MIHQAVASELNKGSSFAAMSHSSQAAPPPRQGIGIWVAYGVLATIIMVPWLLYGYLFSGDEYVHLYNTCILDNFSPFYQEWFAINTFPEPNFFGQYFLLLLTQVLPPALAEKLIIILIAGLNGYAFLGRWNSRYLTSAEAPSPILVVLAATLSLLFFLSATWQLGFVNYLVGMVGVLAALRHTYGYRGIGIKPLAWSVFLYFCHPMAFLFFLGTYSLRYLVIHRDTNAKYYGLAIPIGQALIHGLIAFGLPFATLIVYLVTHSSGGSLAGASPFRLLGLVFYHLDFILFSEGETAFAFLTMAATIALLALGASQLLKRDYWTWALPVIGSGVLVSALVLAPNNMAGGALIHQRLMPMVFIYMLWSLSPFLKARVVGFTANLSAAKLGYLTVAVLAIALSGWSLIRTQALQPVGLALDELKEFSQEIPANSVVLPVAGTGSFITPGSGRLSPKPVMHHFATVIPCEQNIVMLDNYEAKVGYFPLLWNEDRNPFAELGESLEAHPATLDIAGKAWAAQHVNYVLSYGPLAQAVTPDTYTWLQNTVREISRSDQGTYILYEYLK